MDRLEKALKVLLKLEEAWETRGIYVSEFEKPSRKLVSVVKERERILNKALQEIESELKLIREKFHAGHAYKRDMSKIENALTEIIKLKQ